ncbi:hypothetical protein G9A89_017162 [Geosiphon pyriformis]|nr:hypothetical protein G9A89_017162 [Geosiphon pyriformis]
MSPPKPITAAPRNFKRSALSDVSNIPVIKPLKTKTNSVTDENAGPSKQTLTKPVAPITLRAPIQKNAIGVTGTFARRTLRETVNHGALENEITVREEKVVFTKVEKQTTTHEVKVALPKPEVNRPVFRNAMIRQERIKQPSISTTLLPSTSHLAKKPKVYDWDDLDVDDHDDPLMVSEYVVEIFEYLKGLELETMPNPNYMETQKELAWKMRSILVDWLIEAHNRFRLLPETLFLAVNIVDRFLSARVVSLVKLQLVGITAMFIASKYEETLAPSMKNFIYMSDGGYTEQEILKAERYILQTLDFKLSYPSPMNFLRRSSKADNYEIHARTVAKYLLEVTLLDHRFLAITPSKAAASALYLARQMIGSGEWHANLVHYSNYTEEELRPCVELIIDYLRKPMKYDALYKKYATKRFMKASIFVQETINKYNNQLERNSGPIQR